MIAPTEARRWYALIAAAPDPESQERLNIGLLLHDQGRQQLVYSAGLKRLKCLVPAADVEVYGAVLKHLSKTVAEGVPLDLLQRMTGPQLVVSSPRGVTQPFSGDVVEMLVQKHLAPDPSRTDSAGSGESRQVGARVLSEYLDRAISQALPIAFGVDVARRARFSNLYPQVRKPRGRIPSVDRAIRGPRHDLLIGAVLLNGGDAGNQRSRAARLGQAFWQYKEIRHVVRGTTGRDLRTFGILVRKEPASGSADLGSYIRHLWEADADDVASTRAEGDTPEAMREALEWAAAE